MNKIFMELITYPMFNIELSVNIKPGICKKKYAKATKKISSFLKIIFLIL